MSSLPSLEENIRYERVGSGEKREKEGYLRVQANYQYFRRDAGKPARKRVLLLGSLRVRPQRFLQREETTSSDVRSGGEGTLDDALIIFS